MVIYPLKPETSPHYTMSSNTNTPSNITKINQEILIIISEKHSIRIVAILPTSHLSPQDYTFSISTLLHPFTSTWQPTHLTRLLAVDAYPCHTFTVIDIKNHRYDYSTAHKRIRVLPVYVLRLSRRSGKWRFFRRVPEDRRVALDIADLHWSNGQSPIPDGAPVYMDPRRD